MYSNKNTTHLEVAGYGDKAVAIVNVGNGYGSSDPWEISMFKACFEALKAGGNKVLAYIHSSYGQRELELMENDFDKWISDYGYE